MHDKLAQQVKQLLTLPIAHMMEASHQYTLTIEL
jgi:hypothetical protein